MAHVYLVGVDGSDPSNRAVDYAAEQAKATGATLILAHVIDWSGYGFLGVEELAERHKHRDAEIAAAEEKVIAPALTRAESQGVMAEAFVHHGNATETLIRMIADRGVSHVFVGRNGQSQLEAMVFGSTTNALVQQAPVPVTVMP